MVAFANQFLTSISEELTSDDISKIQAKANVLFNNKLKEERGKDSKGKKSAKPPKLNVERGIRSLTNAGYDMYEVEGLEGGEDYGGYDKVDFM